MAKKERLPKFWVRKYGHQEELRKVVLSLMRKFWKAYEGLLASLSSFLSTACPYTEDA